MPQDVTLKVSVDKTQAVADLRLFRGEVNKAFGDIIKQSQELNSGFGKLALNPDGINFGVKNALGDLAELNAALKETRENLRALSGGRVTLFRAGATSGADPIASEKVRTTALEREAEKQRRIDDLTQQHRYRTLQISAGEYRSYLAQTLSDQDTSAQRSLRFSREMANVQLDVARGVTRIMREEDQKRGEDERKAARQQINEARQSARLMSGAALVARGTALSGIGSGIRTAGQAMTYGYSAPLAAAGGYAISKAIDYESDFANVKKTVGGSDAELKALRADLEALSTQVPESFKSITDIASTVGQLGVARDQVKNVTKDIIQLHVATKLSTDTGALAMVKFANSIGEPAQNIGRLGSVISELDKDSKATSNEVLSMALRIGGVGHVAGLSGPQILAFANAFAGVGVRAQQGGSAISTAIIQIDRATNAGGAKLAQFANVAGMSADQFKKAFKENAAGALASFIEGLGKLHDKHVDLIPIMDALGLKSKLEIDAMLRASGAGDDLSKALGRVDKAYADNTATGERYKRATDNTKSALIELRNEGDQAAAKLGTAMLPVVKALIPDAERLAHTISGWVDAFEKLPEPVRNGAMELLALSMAAGPVVAVVGNIVSGVGSLTRAVGFFKALRTVDEMKGILTGLKGVEGGAKDAGEALSGASTKAGGLLSSLKNLSGAPFKITVTLAILAGAVAAGKYIKGQVQSQILDPTDKANAQEANQPMSANWVDKRATLTDDIKNLKLIEQTAKARLSHGPIPLGLDMNEAQAVTQKYGLPRPAPGQEQHLIAAINPLINDLAKQLPGINTLIKQARALEKAQRTGGAEGSTPDYMRAMMADSGHVIGLSCGEAISHYLGRQGAATAADRPENRVHPDAQGKYPEGTIFRVGRRFHGEKDGANMYSEGHYGMLHYAPSGPTWVEANYGIKRGVTTNRPFDMTRDVHEATWGGAVHAYLPTAAMARDWNVNHVAPSRKAAPYNPALFQGKTTDEQKRANQQIYDDLYSETHNDFQNKRHKALRDFEDAKADPNVTDKAAAQRLYLATVKQIDKDEATEQQKHHKELEAAEAAHQKRMRALELPYQKVIRKKQAQDALAHATRQAVTDHLAALTQDPETLSLNKEEEEAKRLLRKRLADYGANRLGPYTPQQQADFSGAQGEYTATLADINRRRDEKKQRDADKVVPGAAEAAQYTKETLADTTQLQREVWQHAGGDMKIYFASLRTEADAALAEVQAKYGVGSKTPNAGAVTAAQGQHDAKIAVIGQQEVDANLRHQDEVKAHDLEQNKISLADYITYLTSRRDAYAQYSAEWLALDNQIYQKDEDIQRRQLDAIEELFRKHSISLEQYQKLLGQLAAKAPALSPVHREIEQAAAGAETKSNRQMVGGTEFWDGLAGSAGDAGSKVLTALLHPKDKKSIFKGLWTDLLGSLESGATGSLSKMIKNLFTGGLSGGGSGGGIGGWLGSLFGGGRQTASSSAGGVMGLGAGASMGAALGGLGIDPGMSAGGGGGMSGLMSMAGMLGGKGGMLGGKGGLMGGLLGHGGLAGLFAHGGLFTSGGALGGFGAALPWIGGGLLAYSLLKKPLGNLFKHLHFAQGGFVPGSGRGDTVPALLTPGEFVLSRPMLQGLASLTPRLPGFVSPALGGRVSPQRGEAGAAGTTVHMHGDHHYHSELDIQTVKKAWSSDREHTRRRNVPAS